MKSDYPAKEAYGGMSSSAWEGGCRPAPRLVASALSRFLESVQWAEISVSMVCIQLKCHRCKSLS